MISVTKNPIRVLKVAVNNLFANKEIFFPYCIVIFAQFLIMEILFFYPRWPLKPLLGPIISKLWGESYLHYPFNFILMPNLYEVARIPVYIFITSFCICLSIAILMRINNEKKVIIGNIFKETLPWYLHIVTGAFITYLVILAFINLYDPILNRALIIRSQQGIFFIIKQVVILGTPYFNLILNIFANVLMAYILPIIIIENKKIFPAILMSFRFLFRKFWCTLWVVAIPSLFYIPILVLRTSLKNLVLPPEATLWITIFSTFITVSLDAVIFTGLATLYLSEKETA